MQGVLSGRMASTTPQQRAHPDFPLRAFVLCDSCGRGLTGSWSKGRSEYYAYLPDGYCRPVDGQPAVVEIAFLTRDVSASFAKAIAEGAVPITAPGRMPWGLEVAYVRAPEGAIIGFSEPPPAAR